MASSSDLADILAVRGLVAGYGGRPVASGIGMTLKPGDILGLLGANGSGKSTLLKAITGQIRLEGGSVTIDGVDLAGAPERAKVGFGLAIDPPDLPAALTGRQYLQLVASIRGCVEDDWPGVDIAGRLGLRRWIERPIAEYSLGTRAKIAIAAALLGAPPLLIFDESLNGLDPLAAFEVKRIIRALALSGRHAAIISTHVVEAVPGLCTRAVLLADGRIARDWDARQLAEANRTPGAFEADVMRALEAQAAEA
ncbi:MULTISPECIES: ABC transporter ATP-binding protein [unclassified Mesorhizobium]|uniref:ATP-binding cassette domain-containing protein n=1 Tax=unclassified Mesorhizobium TaxID=325217 RepID=UPI000FCC6684|nr:MULTISPECIES: ABC transporter ATP-binding protein [unclassified Mesorhizobium]RUU62791.1 ABC transporter ATP-binding protein [Mesorhizobium sp. M7A.T.Ca.TU.009.01.1.1]RUU84779.1 ABC transporter ATP-binding protein [Mesorhizobium sp. M7A.T.Ca.TU.009.01.1.2]RUT89250.1 ABC transporter ATP-binding protein [Mesorhizobium sp. M7A.T.Ca.US.000.02.1.1]RUT90125.1 ABC transporter ATP-binding protein [Mesorhizobium sp. M7A.T.Ca.US.000.02.2.1]RUT97959.1 ABC transporter ATP-binding protein [Mesorhizobium